MAVKKLLLHFGQSNDGPFGDYAGWAAENPEIDLTNAGFFPNTISIGAYGDRFTIPGNLGLPGFGTVDLRGRALSKVRYYTEFNPICTGYKTYPCVGRGRALTAHPVLTVEQTFTAAAIDRVVLTRFRDGTTHAVIDVTPNAAGATLKIVPLSSFVVSATNIGTDVFTLAAPHGYVTDTPVALAFNSGGALPAVVGTPLAEGTTYYVRSPSGADLQLARTPGGAAIDLTGLHGATLYVYAVADAWQNSTFNDQFSYALAGLTGTNPVVLPLGFGSVRTGTLLGLRLRCTAGANANASRLITGYNELLREVKLASAFTNVIGLSDAFVIEPPVGTFRNYGMWLPWCPFEAGHVSGKVNPYLPGFNYPNHWHVFQNYRWDAGVGQGVMLSRAAYHITLGVRLQETLGEEVYILGGDVGGSSLARSEVATEPCDFAWWDASQMSTWAPGETNSCLQAFYDSIDASIAAAARDGDTLEVALVVFNQGETDAYSEVASANYYTNLKTLFASLRSFLVARGLWTRSPESLPIVQPTILSQWPLYETVNAAKLRVTDENRFLRVVDSTLCENAAGHFTGKGHSQLAQLIIQAYQDIVAANDQQGEVDIANAALALIGDTARVTSLDPPDGSAQAALCALHYPRARDTMLEQGQWSFAMRRRTAVAITSPSTNWQFAYQLPADCLKLVSVLPSGLGDDYPVGGAVAFPRETATEFLLTGASPTQNSTPAYQFQLENSGNSTVILSNVEDAELRYVARVTNTRQFSNQFVEAVQWKLASQIVGATVKGDAGRAESERCLRMAMLFTEKAGSVDTVQQRLKPQRIAPWHKNR